MDFFIRPVWGKVPRVISLHQAVLFQNHLKRLNVDLCSTFLWTYMRLLANHGVRWELLLSCGDKCSWVLNLHCIRLCAACYFSQYCFAWSLTLRVLGRATNCSVPRASLNERAHAIWIYFSLIKISLQSVLVMKSMAVTLTPAAPRAVSGCCKTLLRSILSKQGILINKNWI